MSRYKKDLVAFIAENVNRNILRVLLTEDPMIAADLGRALKASTGIKFKSTSSLAETLQRLVERGFVKRIGDIYHATKLGRKRWVTIFLNTLLDEKIDRGKPIRE